MDTLRRIALGVCVLCVVGGIVQIFWPENSGKPVINTALVLYIIASVLQIGPEQGGRLPEIDWTPQSEETVSAPYLAYAEELALETSVRAVGQLLEEAGIEAELCLTGGVCQVTLAQADDIRQAEQLLDANCGELPWVIRTGEGGEA